jgi:hypothetical protein
MAGGPVDLSDASLRKLAVMLGESSAKQSGARQPFHREPMGERASSTGHTAAELKIAEEIKKAEKELNSIHSARASLQKAEETRSRRIRQAEEAEAGRRQRALEAEVKLKKAIADGDLESEQRAERELRILKKKDDLQTKNARKFEAFRNRQAKTNALIDKQDKAAFDRERTLMQLRAISAKGRAAQAIQKMSDRDGILGTLAKGIHGSREARLSAGLARATGGQPTGGGALAPLAKGVVGAGLGAVGGIAQGVGGMVGGDTGTLGNVISGLASGAMKGAGAGIPGMLIGAVTEGGGALIKEGIKAAADMDDKLLRLAGNYVKFTGQIPKSNSEAVVSLAEFHGMFRDTYRDTIEQTRLMGVSVDATRERIAAMSKAFRPMGAEAGKVMTQLAVDSFKFQTAFGKTGEEMTSIMEDSFRNFSSSGEKISEQMASIYNVFQAGNDVFKKELGSNIIRMDEFSKITFESARRADLWSFNYGEVAKKLTTIAALASKAGMAEERRQKIAKGIIDFQTGTQSELFNILGGRKEIESRGDKFAKMDRKDVVKELSKDYDTAAAEQMADVYSELGKGKISKDMAAKYIGSMIGGSTKGMQYQDAALKDILKQTSGDMASQIETLRALLAEKGVSLNDGELLFVMKNLTDKNSTLDKELARLNENNKKLDPKTGQPISQKKAFDDASKGMEAIQYASNGVIDSSKNLAEAFTELNVKLKLTGAALDIMAATFGDEDAKKRVAFSRLQKTEEFKTLPKEIQQIASEGGFDPKDFVKMMDEQHGLRSSDAFLKANLKRTSGVSDDIAAKMVNYYREKQKHLIDDIMKSAATDDQKLIALKEHADLPEADAYKRIGASKVMTDSDISDETLRKQGKYAVEAAKAIQTITPIGTGSPNAIRDTEQQIRAARERQLGGLSLYMAPGSSVDQRTGEVSMAPGSTLTVKEDPNKAQETAVNGAEMTAGALPSTQTTATHK